MLKPLGLKCPPVEAAGLGRGIEIVGLCLELASNWPLTGI
jgi:hypothetical protein